MKTYHTVKKLAILSLLYAVALLIIFSGVLIGYLFLPNDLSEKKILIIKHGLSTSYVSQLLQQEQIIKNDLLFTIIAKVYAWKNLIKSGEYEFRPAMSHYDVLQKITSGISVVRRMVLAEGLSVHEIIAKIQGEDRLLGELSSEMIEGQLMPATYFYSYGDRKEKIIDHMRQSMSKILTQMMRQLPVDSPLKTKEDILILASIIEKEAGNEQEKPMIAAVFINRLKKGMRLQADPTVIYAITQGKSRLGRPLTGEDIELQLHSGYNTYKIAGLPQGAICCPSASSLRAAVNPAQTEYLYFVANGQGGHNFAKTIQEHNKNVQKYRQGDF